MALGVIEECLRLCVDYAKNRTLWGQEIGQFQLIQLKLANMEVARMNVRNMLFRVIEAAQTGTPISLAEASAIKWYCSQAATDVAMEAVQLFGGNGYMTEYRVEQLARDAKSLMIYAGSNEVQITHVARGLLTAASHACRLSARGRSLRTPIRFRVARKSARPRALVQADRRRRRHVEAFGVARHRDPHPVVASPASSAGRPCASGPNSHAVGADKSASSRLISPSTVVASTCKPGGAQCGNGMAGIGFGDHRDREDAARRGAQALAVVRIDAVAGQHHRVGAHRVGDADQRARVAGLGDLHRDRHQPRRVGKHVGQRRFGQRAHRDQSDRSHGLRQRFCGTFGHQVHRDVGQHRAESGRRRFRGEHLGNQSAPQRCLDEVGPLGEKAGGAASSDVAVQLDRCRHPGGAFGERQAASPDGALTSSGSAPLATSTSAVKAAGSLTAISARFLRSTSTPAAFRPWISRL